MTVAFDTETFLIGPAQVAPKMVCLSYTDGHEADVLHVQDPRCRELVDALLDSSDQLVGHNLPFDLGVVANEWPELFPKIWEVYEQDRLVDTQVRQKLIDIARGEYRGYRNAATDKWVEHHYHLKDLAARHGYPHDLDKDTWRLRYSELYPTPVEQWPEGAVEYSRHDALSTYHVWLGQEPDAPMFLKDQYRQSRYHWALHLVSAWGVRTDRFMVDKLEQLTRQILADHEEMLLDLGLLIREKKGIVKKVKLAKQYAADKWLEQGRDPVLTETGQVSLSEDAAKSLGDPVVLAFQEYAGSQTVLQRVMELRAGIDFPIHTRFEELAVSGRSTSSKPNIQARQVEPTMRASCKHHVDRKKFVCPQCSTPYDIAGDRECFVPREGNVFYVADVPGLELRTIGQKCKIIVGYSNLVDMLNAGKDPHLAVAATKLGISYEEALIRKKNPEDVEIYLARQTGKIVNFGLDALLGWRGLIEQARTKYDIIFNKEEAQEAIEVYYITLPEMREFHAWVKMECAGGLGTIEQLFVERIRGLIPPTEASNTLSQGLGADATKAGLYALVRACYHDGPDVLRGSRVVNYVHDEYILEGPEDAQMAHRSQKMSEVLCDAINQFLPDVPVPVSEMVPTICRRWSKQAKPQKDGTPWEWEVAKRLGSPGYAT